MGSNNITGTIPDTVGDLSDLRILSLGSNNIQGTISKALVRLGSIEELDLGTNNLTGAVPEGLCGGAQRMSYLRDLILSNNQLTGTLSVPDCEAMIYLDAQNNNLTGPLPDLSSYRQLHILRLGYNNFEGPVSFSSFDLRLLVLLDLSDNWLNGTIPGITSNGSQLTLVRLYQNNFSGPIPDGLFDVPTLSSVQLFSNLLTGSLPDNIGASRGLVGLLLSNNSLYGTLPNSLQQLASTQGTLDTSRTNLSCCGLDPVPGLGYRSFDESRARLPSFLTLMKDLQRPVNDNNNQTSFYAMRCPTIGYVSSDDNVTVLYNWNIDPEYFLYQDCICLEGYEQVWFAPSSDGPSMGPRMICSKITSPWYKTYPWAVVLIVVGGLVIVLWLTWLMCFRKGRNAAIVQSFFNIRKRIQGEPVGGQVSIVVTDIEGYSDLMKQSPELMTRALNLHNAIIRKSRWNNFGYTLEQEGDSYALVFYEAYDAVVFCVQTQLALNRQSWPEGLFNGEIRETGSKRRPQAPSLLNAISVMTNNLTASLFGGRVSNTGQGSDERTVSMIMQQVNPRASADGIKPDSRQSSTIAQPAVREFSALATPSAVGGGFNKGHYVLFNGMRVRMGIATGVLPPGSNSKGSAVMDMAKMVSDAANGGQIMVCDKTFKNIKERIEEFSAVDHNGMNYKKLNSLQPPWYACLRRKHMRNPDDTVVLDMGEYTYCPGSKRLPLFNLEATPADDTPGAVAHPPTPKRLGKSTEPMRLFQIVPPALVGRAKMFGNKVTVKDEWFCSDAPYFDAPGTLDAPLGFIEGPVLLPPITMAFLIAENGKVFGARFRRDTRRVNDVVVACIRACLRCVPGGYLCRMQDGDLKYMVAFSNPQAAVEWSLLLQDVLMYADWPEAAVKFWREEYDERGRMVFRGPRMKIGLCEGNPRSIIPDHIGRADYHGASINQSARYMDAAAHGGMVALEAALAIKVMELWRIAARPAPPQEAGRGSSGSVAGPGAASEWSAGSVMGSEFPDASGVAASHAKSRMAAVREVEGSGEPLPKVSLGAAAAQGVSPFAVAGQAGPSAYKGPDGRSSASGVGAPAAAAAASGAGAGKSGGSEPLMNSRWSFKRLFQHTAPPTSGGGKAEKSHSQKGRGAGQAAAASQSTTQGQGQEGTEELPTFRLMVGTSESGASTATGPAGGAARPDAPAGEAETGTATLVAVPAAAGLEIHAQGQPSLEGPEATLSSAAVASLRATHQEAASAAPAGHGAASGPGPVAEGNEVDVRGNGIDDEDATAAEREEFTAAAVGAIQHPNGDGGGADAATLASSAVGSSAPAGYPNAVVAAAAAAGHVDLLAAESGPSMTSLTGSDNTLVPGTPPTFLLSHGGGGRTGSATSDAATVSDPSTAASDDRGAVRRRPSPLKPVPSPVISCDGSASLRGDSAEDSSQRASAANRSQGESLYRADVDRNMRGSAPQLTTLASTGADGTGRLAPGGAAASTTTAPTTAGHAPAGAPPIGSAMRHPPSAMRHSGSGMLRSHVSFATSDGTAAAVSTAVALPAAAAAAAASVPSASSAASSTAPMSAFSAETVRLGPAGGPQRTAFSATTVPLPGAPSISAASGPASGASALQTAPSGRGGPLATALSSATCGMRSPRPPALPLLALPSEKERNAALRADRAAAEAARKVSVDAPVDARYSVRVAAYRIGTFRFKGNPEPIPMAHIVLDHLAGRRFPNDAPKGKGAKVGDAFGLVEECETTLPDLASAMRDRYMLSRPQGTLTTTALEDARASPSGRRLRLLLGGSSTASGQSPSSPGPSMFRKSRSLGVRAQTGSGPGSEGGGGSPAAGTVRRGSNLMTQMVQQLATVSARWANNGGPSRETPDVGMVASSPAPARSVSAGMPDGDRVSGQGAGSGAGARGLVGMVSIGLAEDGPAASATSSSTGHKVRAGSGSANAAVRPSSRTGSESGVVKLPVGSGAVEPGLAPSDEAAAPPGRYASRPSPLRFVSNAESGASAGSSGAGGRTAGGPAATGSAGSTVAGPAKDQDDPGVAATGDVQGDDVV